MKKRCQFLSSVLAFCILSVPIYAAASSALTLAAVIPPCYDGESAVAERCKQGKAEWQAFAKSLGEKIGQPITVMFSKESNLLSLLENGEVDLSYVKQVPFAELQESEHASSFQAIAIAIEADGSSKYKSIFLTKTGKKVAVDDIKGEKIGFVQGSASGSYLPTILLKQKGFYNPDNIVVYPSNYAALEALHQGKVFGVFIADVIWRTKTYQSLFAGQFQTDFSLSPDLPSPLFVINRDKVDEKTAQALRQALPNTEIHSAALNGFSICHGECSTLASLAAQKVGVDS